MNPSEHQRPSASEDPFPRAPGMAAIAGLAGFYAFYLAWRLQGDETDLWLPGLGMGIILVAWCGLRTLPVLFIVLLTARWWTHAEAAQPFLETFVPALIDALLHVGLVGVSWWLYHRVMRGALWLDDPRSATLFLLLVPGILAAGAAAIRAAELTIHIETSAPFLFQVTEFWLNRMIGVLVVAPVLIVTCTPIVAKYQWVAVEPRSSFFGEREADSSGFGDRVELFGLAFVSSVLGVMLSQTYGRGNVLNGILWASCLVLIVWTSIRQGLRGGCIASSAASLCLLCAAQVFLPSHGQLSFRTEVQSHVLAFCSSGLLAGVSASWIRANELRFRHVLGRVPFVIYSARLPYGVPSLADANKADVKRDSKVDLSVGPSISKLANVMLVSPASKVILDRPPETLIGPFTEWLERIEPADRELVIAALAQLCLQRTPVTCEYRIRILAPTGGTSGPPQSVPAAPLRWLRDTMSPHYSEDGLIDGWEGLIEDITDHRTLSQNLRKMTNMFQALVSNLPTGVYFVQAPQGTPILVNARARQLLGQREDSTASLDHLSRVYRLHRPDGTRYPVDELPVTRALRQGIACRANDIVIHRADGRKVPLITWAAPIDLHNSGKPDAAVWVLEDWSTMQQAEQALRESELRLRAVIETMDEGVIVQDITGGIIDCNAAACTILGQAREDLLRRNSLAQKEGCIQEDGIPIPFEKHPDQRALRDHQPVRRSILGVPSGDPCQPRWLLVNSYPLPVGPVIGLNHQRASVVTTFADITEQLNAQRGLQVTRDKYQSLVETLPFMLLQRDRDFNIVYQNPAATVLTGYSREEMLQPGFCESILHPNDLPKLEEAARIVAMGEPARAEVRFRAKDGSTRTVLGFFQPCVTEGEISGSTCLVVDITRQRRLEEELQHAQQLELVGRLASGTVHEINNLLTVLMGLTNLAKSEAGPTSTIWPYLTRIEDVGDQAAHLAGQLLTFSKRRPRRLQSVDLNATVTQTLKLASSVLSANIEVTTQLDPTIPFVLGDEIPLKQVVMNLCLNARDAMPHGGKLILRTDHASPTPEGETGDWVHLSIEDTGEGMDEHVRLQVFDPFFSTKECGTGLGLTVVCQFIKEFGGKIELTSEKGKGTRFDIWLPHASPVHSE